MRIAVIGSGAWGCALGMSISRANHEVIIYSRDLKICEEINNQHSNLKYLPEISLPKQLKASANIAEIINSDILLLSVPAQSIRQICLELKSNNIESSKSIIICSKGIEKESLKLMSEVVKEILPHNPIAVLSGPNFAAEVAQDLPAISSIASEDYNFALTLSNYLSSDHFRIYPNDDIIGTQVMGAVKNVLAIATGIVIGKEFGENAKAAVISRGMCEIANLSLARGGKIETLLAPAGFGDIHLTCSNQTSRNTAYGIALGKKGESAIGGVLVEGFYSAEAVYMLAQKLAVKMPLCESVYKILHKNASLDHVIYELLERPINIDLLNLRK